MLLEADWQQRTTKGKWRREFFGHRRKDRTRDPKPPESTPDVPPAPPVTEPEPPARVDIPASVTMAALRTTATLMEPPAPDMLPRTIAFDASRSRTERVDGSLILAPDFFALAPRRKLALVAGHFAQLIAEAMDSNAVMPDYGERVRAYLGLLRIQGYEPPTDRQRVALRGAATRLGLPTDREASNAVP